MPPELVIFDCDGVLIDSEGVASVVTAAAVSALGWPMTPDEALGRFLGMSITDIEPLIAARIGAAVPAGWRDELAAALIAALRADSRAIAGVRPMLERLNGMGVDWRVASNSSMAEMAVKFAKCGLEGLTAGRCFAAADHGRPKPAPDVFVAAAGAVAPAACLVVEDSPLGVSGAVAAGMVCYGFAPHGAGAALLAAGARGIFRKLDDLFGVLG
jgi:HAD superfamily hydrolase (TIGR01509 family)